MKLRFARIVFDSRCFVAQGKRCGHSHIALLLRAGRERNTGCEKAGECLSKEREEALKRFMLRSRTSVLPPLGETMLSLSAPSGEQRQHHTSATQR